MRSSSARDVVVGQAIRWSLLACIRQLSTAPSEQARRASAGSAALLVLWAGAYAWWVLTGGGPWRALRLNAAPVAPRGLPAGAFWRAGATHDT